MRPGEDEISKLSNNLVFFLLIFPLMALPSATTRIIFVNVLLCVIKSIIFFHSFIHSQRGTWISNVREQLK